MEIKKILLFLRGLGSPDGGDNLLKALYYHVHKQGEKNFICHFIDAFDLPETRYSTGNSALLTKPKDIKAFALGWLGLRISERLYSQR